MKRNEDSLRDIWDNIKCNNVRIIGAPEGEERERKDQRKYFSVCNLWAAAKAVLRGKFIAIQAYLKKQEKSQINNLSLHLKELEKEEQTKPKVSKRKEIIKIRAEINEIKQRKQ